MTRKIKNVLLVEEGIWKVFLKPSILATKITDKVDIEFTYKYNLLGCFTLNIVQLLFDLIYYGINDFNIKNYLNIYPSHRTIYGVRKEYFSKKEIEYLQQFPQYPRVIKPDLTKARI